MKTFEQLQAEAKKTWTKGEYQLAKFRDDILEELKGKKQQLFWR